MTCVVAVSMNFVVPVRELIEGSTIGIIPICLTFEEMKIRLNIEY